MNTFYRKIQMLSLVLIFSFSVQQIGNAQSTTTVIVPSTQDLWLAGMPAGSIASDHLGWISTAPGDSPVQVPLPVADGAVFTFAATGGVFNGPSTRRDGPEGSTIWIHYGTANGLSNITAPINSLIGVFLDDSAPDNGAVPATLNFSTPASRDFASLSPALKQVFFIGDGFNSLGDVQEFVAPVGATRLFIGSMDAYGWSNNVGEFEVDITSDAVTDSDSDGVDDVDDDCPGTPSGEGVNENGCSCSQVTVDDNDDCTLDECIDGIVTNTFQDADGDGVCDANDVCPGGDDNLDNDMDGMPDFCDDDDDNDGIVDDCDTAPFVDNFTFDGIDSNFPTQWLCGNRDNKVKVCHVPAGNPANAQTLCISPNAVSSHVGDHGGDYLGECTCTEESSREIPITKPSSSKIGVLDLEISPNPASDFIYLHMHGVENNATLRILDQLGREVMSQSLMDDQHFLQVNLSNGMFQNGIYFALISSEGGNLVKRFVVHK